MNEAHNQPQQTELFTESSSATHHMLGVKHHIAKALAHCMRDNPSAAITELRAAGRDLMRAHRALGA